MATEQTEEALRQKLLYVFVEDPERRLLYNESVLYRLAIDTLVDTLAEHLAAITEACKEHQAEIATAIEKVKRGPAPTILLSFDRGDKPTFPPRA